MLHPLTLLVSDYRRATKARDEHHRKTGGCYPIDPCVKCDALDLAKTELAEAAARFVDGEKSKKPMRRDVAMSAALLARTLKCEDCGAVAHAIWSRPADEPKRKPVRFGLCVACEDTLRTKEG